jgi:hypothetical protein
MEQTHMDYIDEYTGPLMELDARLDRMLARLDQMDAALIELRDHLATLQQTAPAKRRQPVEAYVLWALALILTVAGVVGSLV